MDEWAASTGLSPVSATSMATQFIGAEHLVYLKSCPSQSSKVIVLGLLYLYCTIVYVVHFKQYESSTTSTSSSMKVHFNVQAETCRNTIQIQTNMGPKYLKRPLRNNEC